ncbi:uncharacterized protein BDW43DRAFT_290668, partial [Aspergillus alliaceus]|uniref:uncharacterized protein n=1 Tax=Petromyces alliaceus TaxID=209559 RepID=UPI0012A49BDF
MGNVSIHGLGTRCRNWKEKYELIFKLDDSVAQRNLCYRTSLFLLRGISFELTMPFSQLLSVFTVLSLQGLLLSGVGISHTYTRTEYKEL